MQYLSEIKVTNKAEHFLKLISLDDDQRKAMHYESWYPIIHIDLKEKIKSNQPWVHGVGKM